MTERRSPLIPGPGRYVLRADTIEDQRRTPSGLIIVQLGDPAMPVTGTVFAEFECWLDERGVRHEPLYMVGDRVVFSKHGGFKVTVEKIEYILIREQDILALIKETSKVLEGESSDISTLDIPNA